MVGFKFVHAADLHLDSPFKGISAIDEAISEDLAEATFNSFEKIIKLCLEEDVDFLLIAGDVYDSENKSLRAQIRFIDGLERLSAEGIKTFVVHGNHDPSIKWSSNLTVPENVHIFTGKKVHKQTVEKDGEEIVEIYGYSYNQRDIKESVIPEFEEKYQQARIYQIGLLHCNLSSSNSHEPYAPCTKEELKGVPMDYWALGHVHNREIVSKEPNICYPGNSQGRNIRESGERGCYIVSVDENANTEIEFVSTCSIIWENCEIDIEGIKTFQELRRSIFDAMDNLKVENENCPLIIRINLKGRGKLGNELKKQNVVDDLLEELRESESSESQYAWVEKIKVNTDVNIDRDRLREGGDFVAEIIQLYVELYEIDGERDRLYSILDPLFESRRGIKYLEQLDDEELIELIKKAESLSLDYLLEDHE